jgi:hypothetical protein
MPAGNPHPPFREEAADGSGLGDKHRAGVRASPSPPAPLSRCAGERGEFNRATRGVAPRPRSFSRWYRLARHIHNPARRLSPLPLAGEGAALRPRVRAPAGASRMPARAQPSAAEAPAHREIAARRRAAVCVRGRPPSPTLPRKQRGGGRTAPQPETGATFIPSPACGRGCGSQAAGEGPRGRQRAARRRAVIRRHPNLPQQFWGRCEPGRAEGAPRLAPDLGAP